MNDSNPEVRRLTLYTILKLIPFEPKLLPTIDHFIFKLLSFLKLRKSSFSEVETEIIRDLLVIIKYAPVLIKDKVSIILDFLIFHLDDLSEKKVKTVVEIIDCVSKLIILDSSVAHNYFDKLSGICIHILETGNVCFFECVFSTLTSLIKVTGYHLILLFRYDFYKFGFEVLQRPISFDIKAEIMKFLGSLGAFDLRFIRKINKMREGPKLDKHTSKLDILNLFRKLESKKLICENYIKKPKKDPESVLLDHYETFVQNISRFASNKASLPERGQPTDREEHFKANPQSLQQAKPRLFRISRSRELMSDISSFESLLQYSATIMFDQIFCLLSSTDFNNIVRVQILDSLTEIVEYLGPLVYKFHSTVYPNLLNTFLLFGDAHLQLKLLKILNIFVKNSSDNFSCNRTNINQLLVLIHENLNNSHLQVTLLDILKTLLKDFKRYLAHRFKPILLCLLEILFKTPNPNVSNIIFNLLCNQLLQDHFEMIIPKFCSFLQNSQVSRIKTTGVLRYFETLINKRNKCSNLQKYLNNIIRAILALLDRLKANPNATVSKPFFSFKPAVKLEYQEAYIGLVRKSREP